MNNHNRLLLALTADTSEDQPGTLRTDWSARTRERPGRKDLLEATARLEKEDPSPDHLPSSPGSFKTWHFNEILIGIIKILLEAAVLVRWIMGPLLQTSIEANHERTYSLSFSLSSRSMSQLNYRPLCYKVRNPIQCHQTLLHLF